MRPLLLALLVTSVLVACRDVDERVPMPEVVVPAPITATAPQAASSDASAGAPVLGPPAMPLQGVTLDPSGKFIVTLWTPRFCKDPNASDCQPGRDRFAVWRFPELERVATLGLRTKGPDAVRVSFSNDLTRLYVVPRMSSSYEAHGLELWDTQTWQPIATPPAVLSSGVGGTESPDARHLLLGDAYTSLELYDLRSGERRLGHTFPMSNAPNRGADVEISDDSRYAVVVDPIGPVEIWDLVAASRRPLTTMKNVGGSAVFLPGTHNFVLSDGDGSLRVVERQRKGAAHPEWTGWHAAKLRRRSARLAEA